MHFEDFTQLNTLDDLAAGSSLEELGFGNAVWVTSVYATLGPLAGLVGLRHLTFSAKRIMDGRVQPPAKPDVAGDAVVPDQLVHNGAMRMAQGSITRVKARSHP